MNRLSEILAAVFLMSVCLYAGYRVGVEETRKECKPLYKKPVDTNSQKRII
jgi:hypothetical protein